VLYGIKPATKRFLPEKAGSLILYKKYDLSLFKKE
jgi:hypothetical protein